MAKATLSLSKKANPQGEHPILIRLDITRTNRPQFKSTVTVLPEYFADGEIKIPMRGKLNTAFRDELLKKKTDIEAFIASLTAISMALPEEARTRKDILEVYEVVKSVNPAEISRTTIIAKKKEQTAANAELVRQLQEARRPGVLDFVRKRLEGMILQLNAFCKPCYACLSCFFAFKRLNTVCSGSNSAHKAQKLFIFYAVKNFHKTTPFRLGRHQRAVD